MTFDGFESFPRLPEAGLIVRLRTRTHLVESVEPSHGYGTLVQLACLDDDAQGSSSLKGFWLTKCT